MSSLWPEVKITENLILQRDQLQVQNKVEICDDECMLITLQIKNFETVF